ncbi:MAG: class I SAM-dependent methyltransferase [Pseudomonadota bacterium]|nr:class I SAM-dependent methyltransferase [Pseudomonadota bacterium]
MMDGLAISGSLPDERALRVEARLAQSAFLAAPLRRLGYDSGEAWAWNNYKPTVLAFVEALRQAGRCDREGVVRLLEVGGGRGPQFTLAEAEKLGVALTVNDIDARELSLAPPGFATACFNIADDVDPTLFGKFDFIFSRMVFEHVRDAPRAWRNIASLLAPGGVALAYHPTLYSPPFILNWLAPEAFSARLLKLFFPWRHDGDYPKFPARYEMCVAEPSAVTPKFLSFGFSEALIAPFFGHGYLRSIPLARDIEGALHVWAERRDIRWLSSYAFTLVRK